MSPISQTEYLIGRWTKDRSISLIHESDIVESPNSRIAVDIKLSARYEGKVLDSLVLHYGDFYEMDSVFNSMQPNSADRGTDSPKGRGHRMPKRKVHPDFETEEEAEEVHQPRKKHWFHFHYAGLPAVLAKLESYVDQLPSSPVNLPATPKGHKAIPPKQASLATVQTRVSDPPSTPISKHDQSLPTTETGSASPPSTPTSHPPDSTISSVGKVFEISPEIVRRASQAKGKGKLVCNLLRALFTRQDLATSSLKGKGQKGESKVLDASKIEALTVYVLGNYPDADRSFIRLKITEKLNDERKAFFRNNREGSS